MTLVGEILVSFLILSGGFFLLVGSIGLAKLPDLMRRLHGPSKSTTLGIGSLLIASMVYFLLFEDAVSFHELLITIFMFLTAPITAHMIAKAHILRSPEQRSELSPTGRDAGWATIDETSAANKDPAERLGSA